MAAYLYSGIVIAAVTIFALFVRAKDIPRPDPVSPTQHLEERKAAIYENLRDLQFEYRVGKLSDADYQSTKLALQKELAVVLAEIDKFEPAAPAKGQRADALQAKPADAKPSAVKVATAAAPGTVCSKCGAKFAHAMKFCGDCGSVMA